MRSADIILMYHEVAADSSPVQPDRRPYVLPVEVFRRQLAAIKASVYGVRTLRDWVGLREGHPAAGVDVPRPPFLIITFDDGDASNYRLAMPLLRESELSATFFVTVGRVGEVGYMSWEEIRALHKAGMEIGSHTLTHRPPTLLNDAELRYELTESKKRLEDRVGAAVESISSPTGFFNARMSDLAGEVGYLAVCCGRIALVMEDESLMALPRIPIKPSVSDSQFQRILSQDRWYLGTLRAKQMIRNGLKRVLGVEAYLAVRRHALRLRRQR